MGNTPQQTLTKEIKLMRMVMDKFKRDRDQYPDLFIEVRTAYRHRIREHDEALVTLHIAANQNKGNAVCINCGHDFDDHGSGGSYCSIQCWDETMVKRYNQQPCAI